MTATPWWSALLDLVLPASCAGCGAVDQAGVPVRDGACARCRRALQEGPVVRWPDPPPPGLPPVWSVTAYGGPVRRLVVAHKERGRSELARPLGDALAAAALAAGAVAGAGRPVAIVPVPSARSAVRARGRDPLAALVEQARRTAPARARPVVVADVLRLVRRPRDQSGLDAVQRAANLSGAMVVRARALPDAAVVLVDDVLTTGATLAEAARALRAGGMCPVGAAVVAATARRYAARAGVPACERGPAAG